MAPAGLLRLLFKDMAEEVLLGGQRVVPTKAEAHGFVFHYPRLEEALYKALALPKARKKKHDKLLGEARPQRGH